MNRIGAASRATWPMFAKPGNEGVLQTLGRFDEFLAGLGV